MDRLKQPFAPSTVVFLGAGASTCAGYPAGADLLPSSQKEAEFSLFAKFRSSWKPWKAFTERAQAALEQGDVLARLLLNPNPEITLSAIDLMDAALQRWQELLGGNAQELRLNLCGDETQ